MMRIDFHSHVLPNVDDGSSSVGESLEMLKTLKRDGVDAVIATPHLYLERDTPRTLLARRDKAYDLLTAAINSAGLDCPRVIKGAEIYFDRLTDKVDLSALCIDGTDCILLEFPYFQKINGKFIKELNRYIDSSPYKIIFAHIERYFRFTEREIVYAALKTGCLAQVNCDSVLSPQSRGESLELIKNGYAQFLGTDTHNTHRRTPRFLEAEEVIRKELGDGFFEEMMAKSKEVLNL